MWRIARLREISDTSPLTKFNIVGFYADDRPNKKTMKSPLCRRHGWQFAPTDENYFVFISKCMFMITPVSLMPPRSVSLGACLDFLPI